MRANEGTDERVAQYLHLCSFPFSTIVLPWGVASVFAASTPVAPRWPSSSFGSAAPFLCLIIGVFFLPASSPHVGLRHRRFCGASIEPSSLRRPFASHFLDAPSHLYKRLCLSVRPCVCTVLFLKVKSTHTRRILCRVSGLVLLSKLRMDDSLSVNLISSYAKRNEETHFA